MNRLLISAVVCVLGGVAGYVLYDKFGHETETQPVQTVQTESQPAATDAVTTEAAASPPQALVATLPDVKLKNRAGEIQSLRAWPGKSMIVNFWATWCGPCRKEIPLLKEIGKTETAFQVVGIAIDYREDVIKFADEIKIDYPILIGEQDGLAAADAFGVSSPGLPFTAFTDNQGRMVAMLMGELTPEKAKIILGLVKRVNKGELTPEAARGAITSKLNDMKMKSEA